MLKKFSAFFLSALIIFFSSSIRAEAGELSVSASSAVLIDADTSEVLYCKNEHEKRGIASTTKILTSLIALEYGEPFKEVIAEKTAVNVEGTSIGLKSGDKITINALVYGMLLESGNDAANVTAYGISGGIEEFSVLMNSYARKIGMKNSNFSNPSGLTAQNHYSTAFDMALLSAEAIKNPVFKRICSTKNAVIDFGDPEISRVLQNHNRLLNEYDGVFGIKTGYTRASGRCLVTACERNGVTLIAVTLNAFDDWNDHKKLYDFGFSLYNNEMPSLDLTNLKIPVVCSDKPTVSVDLAFESEFLCKGVYSTKIYVERFLYPPVKKGDILGFVEFINSENKIVKAIPLVSQDEAFSLYNDVDEDYSLLQKIKKFIERLSF